MDDKQIHTPESIDHYIQNGIRKGKRYKQIQRRSIVGLTASMALILLFVTSVKISPAFAHTVKAIPGMQVIVEMIQGDQGLEDAISNDFIHEVNEEDTHGGVTLSVDRIIVDQARLIIFYSAGTTGEHEFLRLRNIDLLDGNGKKLEASVGFGDPAESTNLQDNGKMNGKIVATFAEDMEVPAVVTLSAKMQNADSPTANHSEARTLEDEWNIEIPIDKEWYEDTREKIQIDETIEIKKQKVHFEKAVIDPTLIALHIKFDEDNPMQLFRFDDLKLMDERGEVWEPIQDGIISSGQDDDYILYFQSNYFRKPEELYLSGSSIRAIDKVEQEVVVDLQEERLTKAPDDGRIQLETINREGGNVEFEFLIEMDAQDEDHHYEIFDTLPVNFDKDYERAQSGFAFTEEDPIIQRNFYRLMNPSATKEIVLKITDYPNRITEPFKFRIK